MPESYDAVIIGAGAGGGFCAMALADKGFKVLLLERGPRFDFRKDFPMNHSDWERYRQPLKQINELVYFSQGAKIKPADFDITGGEYSSTGEFTPVKVSHRSAFSYQRVNGVGGSTLHYQGEAHRYPEHAFKPQSLYGWGIDWPIEHQDLAPYYQQAEKILGVAGNPDNPFKAKREDFPTPAHALSKCSQLAKRGADKLGWHLLENSLALPSKSVDGRSPCQHSGGCLQGCVFGAKSSVDLTAIKRAEQTGNLTIITNAVATKIALKNEHTVEHIGFVHKGQHHKAKARQFILAGGAIETPRLLLHSQSADHPNGIGNQYDLVGRNFMETIWLSVNCKTDADIASYQGPPIDARLWDFCKPKEPLKSGFVLGVSGTLDSRHGPLSYAKSIPGFGRKHKRQMRQQFGRDIQLFGIAEHIPAHENRVSLAQQQDRHGVPMVNIFSDYNQEDRRTLRAMQDKLLNWAQACELTKTSIRSTYSQPAAAHVGGTCRMGTDAMSSVTNQYGQIHGMSNLTIADGSVLPSLGTGDSPSLTIQALALLISESIS